VTGWGIIGAGFIGQKRAKAIRALGDRVVAVADIDRGRADALARQTGAELVASDWREVLAAPGVEAVVIATTHDLLTPIAVAALEAGRHVLVEKPAGLTAADLDRVNDAAAKTGRLVKVGFNHRFHPAFLKAKEIADSGELGPLMFIRGRYGHGGRIGYDTEWRFTPALSGGGELIDQGSHLIDLSRWFLGDFTEVNGIVPSFFWNAAVEDNCFMALRTAAGQVAWLHAGWTEWKNLFSFEIMGRDGKLQIDGLGGSYGTEKLTWYRMLPEMGPPETTSWEYPFADASWDREMAEFKAALAEGRRPLGDGHDARAVLDVIGRIYQEGRR
jgi:predicted dehydrogenase